MLKATIGSVLALAVLAALSGCAKKETRPRRQAETAAAPRRPPSMQNHPCRHAARLRKST